MPSVHKREELLQKDNKVLENNPIQDRRIPKQANKTEFSQKEQCCALIYFVPFYGKIIPGKEVYVFYLVLGMIEDFFQNSLSVIPHPTPPSVYG